MPDDVIQEGDSYTLQVRDGCWKYFAVDEAMLADDPIKKKAFELMRDHGGNGASVTLRKTSGRPTVERWFMYDDIPPGQRKDLRTPPVKLPNNNNVRHRK